MALSVCSADWHSTGWPFDVVASLLTDSCSHHSITAAHTEVIGSHQGFTFRDCSPGTTHSVARRIYYWCPSSSDFELSVVRSMPNSSSFHVAACLSLAYSEASTRSRPVDLPLH